MARCISCKCGLEGVEDADGNLRHAAVLDVVAYKKISETSGRPYYLCKECERKRVNRSRMPRMNHHDGGRVDQAMIKDTGWYDHGENHSHA